MKNLDYYALLGLMGIFLYALGWIIYSWAAYFIGGYLKVKAMRQAEFLYERHVINHDTLTALCWELDHFPRYARKKINRMYREHRNTKR